jgi:hypothetical protein
MFRELRRDNHFGLFDEWHDLGSYELSFTPEWIFTVEVSTRHVCESHIGVNVDRRGFAVANSIEKEKHVSCGN